MCSGDPSRAAPPADCVYTLTSEGLWYLAFDRPSCSRFHQVAYARTDQAQDEVVSDLERRGPPVIVYANETSYDAPRARCRIDPDRPRAVVITVPGAE